MLYSAGYKNRTYVVTNGTALTPKLSDELIKSGLTRLEISVQGVDSGHYKSITGVPIDMDRFVDNIRYLYEHKKDMTIFIKIIDSNLRSEADKEKFYELFNDICDEIHIEHLVVHMQQLGDIGERVDVAQNLYGEEISQRLEVCPLMFYLCLIDAEGDFYLCCVLAQPKEKNIGNIKTMSLPDLWSSGLRQKSLISNLKNGYKSTENCAGCEFAMNVITPYEYLDDYREDLIKNITKMNIGAV
jgi:radical SAM protein with 4Fe4S-binding SPASM domain